MKLLLAAILLLAQVQVATACPTGVDLSRGSTAGVVPGDVLNGDGDKRVPTIDADVKDEG